MQFTAENEPDTRFPEDAIFRARLQEIKLHTFEFTNREGEQQEGRTLQWWWEVTTSTYGPQFLGRKVKGECKAILSNRDDNQFRMWAEALLNRTIPVGMNIDSDDLVGLEADILIGHRPDRKDPRKSWAYVEDVISIDGSSTTEPPF